MSYRLDPWSNYTVDLPGGRYEIFELVTDEDIVEDQTPRSGGPELNLQADEATLNCLKWLLIDQKDVDLEIKTAPVIEDFNYASSDEDIWEALTEEKKESKPVSKYRKVNTTCEWQRCNAQFDDNKAFRKHIVEHFKDYQNTIDSDEFLCEWDLCDFKTNCIEMFERHVLYHEVHARFLADGESRELTNKVPKCTLSGLDRNRLPELPADFECQWKGCQVVNRSLSVLHEHLIDHYRDILIPKQTVMCEWKGCSYSANALHKFISHGSSIHTPISAFACRKCGTTRKIMRTFLAHFLSQAPVKNPDLCCPHCNQLFLRPNQLEGHIKTRHRPVTCDICTLKFLGETQLKIHVANVHLKLRPFKCPKCPKAFPSRNNLRAHMHTHDKKEGGYPCNQCEFIGSTYLVLRKHNYAMHMGRNYPYECHLCGMMFSIVQRITAHFKKVHQLPVPEGFHRYTFKLDEGPVFHLKTSKSYFEPTEADVIKKRPKPQLDAPPMKFEVKLESDVHVKLEPMDDTANQAVGERFSRFRGARKILDSSQ